LQPTKRAKTEDFELTQAIVPKPATKSRYRYAMICSSNINRSMEAHTVLQNCGLDVESYGVGKQLRLPGPQGARCFEFGTPYEEIARALSDEAEAHYTRVGVLDLARRAAATKTAPQRWQSTASDSICRLDVVIVFETRLFEAVVMDMLARDPVRYEPIHLICMDTRDSPKDAVDKGKEVARLCKEIEEADLAVAVPASCLKRADAGELQYMLCYL